MTSVKPLIKSGDLDCGLSGKCFNVIFTMYQNIKSCVKFDGNISESFYCQTGVRQGEHVSPLLFAIFINDLENCLNTEQCNGINIVDRILTDFLKILILLYADDTVIFAENMQTSLNVFHDYCIRWKLTVIMANTKIVVFGSKGHRHPVFNLFHNILEVTDSYKYLGLCFSKNCTYSLTKKCIKS